RKSRRVGRVTGAVKRAELDLSPGGRAIECERKLIRGVRRGAHHARARVRIQGRRLHDLLEIQDLHFLGHGFDLPALVLDQCLYSTPDASHYATRDQNFDQREAGGAALFLSDHNSIRIPAAQFAELLKSGSFLLLEEKYFLAST